MKDCCSFKNIAWWMTLVVAVLAIPSLAFIITRFFFLPGMGHLIVFVLACWLCTYLGMKLMQNPTIADKMDFED